MATATASRRVQLAPYGFNADGDAHGPNPTQKKILDWVDRVRRGQHPRPGIPVLYLRGGVGSGKTRGILAPVIEVLLEYAGIRVLWGRQDFKDLKLSVMDKFFEVCPRQVIVDKSEQYHWYDINSVGSNAPQTNTPPARIYFNGLKDLSGFGSQEFAIVAITEAHETTEMAYRTLKRRCRQVGYPVMILMESEPPNEGHWLERLTREGSDEFDSDIEMWELSTYENWANLPETYKHSLESMPKSWQRKYLYGKAGFIPDGRPFYEGFREEIHGGEFTYNPDKELITGWDFGFHHPAFTVHQIDDMGRWYVLAELLGNEITIDKFCEQVKALINLRFPSAKQWRHFGDPACLQHNDKSEKTSWAVCAEHGFRIVCRQSTYRQRKEIIDGKLSKMVSGKPLMRVDKSCKILIDGMLGGYHYPEVKPGHPVSDNYEAPFRDGLYEHICNSMEYVAVNVFRPIEAAGKEKEKRRRRFWDSGAKINAGFQFA